MLGQHVMTKTYNPSKIPKLLSISRAFKRSNGILHIAPPCGCFKKKIPIQTWYNPNNTAPSSCDSLEIQTPLWDCYLWLCLSVSISVFPGRDAERFPRISDGPPLFALNPTPCPGVHCFLWPKSAKDSRYWLSIWGWSSSGMQCECL